MLQKMINYLRGSVHLEVTGAFPERFLNLCAQNGVAFWNVEWLDTTCLRLTVTRSSSRKAQALAEKTLCTITPEKRAGMPFFLSRFRKRYALLVGLALSLTAVCVLSRFVLTVDVEGNSRVSTAEILSELRRQGLRPGVYGPGLDVSTIGNETLLRMPDLAWMSINLHGTRAEVLVREAIPKPELDNEAAIGDIVAKSGGIILHMEVLEGEAVYKEGDTVAAGEVIISGTIKLAAPEYSEIDRGWRQVQASGRVYARTWRTMTAEIPLEALVKQYTGEKTTIYSLTFLGNRIHFMKNSGISYGQYDKISSTWTAVLPGGQEMPLALTRETIRAYETAAVSIDRDAAGQLLQSRLEEALLQLLGDGEILSAGYTTAEQDGMLRVTLQAECREEIGRFVPVDPLPLAAEDGAEAGQS